MMIEALIHLDATKVRPQFRLTVFVALVLCLGGVAARAQSDSPAFGSLQTHYSLYDYCTNKPKLPILVSAHFTAAFEGLICGSITSIGPGAPDALSKPFLMRHDVPQDEHTFSGETSLNLTENQTPEFATVEGQIK